MGISTSMRGNEARERECGRTCTDEPFSDHFIVCSGKTCAEKELIATDFCGQVFPTSASGMEVWRSSLKYQNSMRGAHAIAIQGYK
jgi:hypothetical protein